jgi:hypothetical protein
MTKTIEKKEKMKEIVLPYTIPDKEKGNGFYRSYACRKPNFVIAFVYSPDKNPVVIKGDLYSVEKHIKSNFPNSLVTYSIYNRSNWSTSDIYINNPALRVFLLKQNVLDPNRTNVKGPRKMRHVLRVYKKNELVFQKQFRKLPRGWIKELNQFVIKSK